MQKFKEYLGNNVYAEFDEDKIRLFLWHGNAEFNDIYLDPEVFNALVDYKERIDNERRKHLPDNPELA